MSHDKTKKRPTQVSICWMSQGNCLESQRCYKQQIHMAFKGSIKKMVQATNYVPLPFALNNLDNPEKLICNSEGIKSTTCEYFTRLYDHSWVCKLPKPWLDTPSVIEVKTMYKTTAPSGLVKPPSLTSVWCYTAKTTIHPLVQTNWKNELSNVYLIKALAPP